MYLYFQHTCFIGQYELAFYDKTFWMYTYFNDGFPSWHVYTFAEAYFTIECQNIATRWACLDIPSQWFTSQSVHSQLCDNKWPVVTHEQETNPFVDIHMFLTKKNHWMNEIFRCKVTSKSNNLQRSILNFKSIDICLQSYNKSMQFLKCTNLQMSY